MLIGIMISPEAGIWNIQPLQLLIKGDSSVNLCWLCSTASWCIDYLSFPAYPGVTARLLFRLMLAL